MAITNTFQACSIVEGFCGGEDATDEERIEAVQYLINTGEVYALQGFYGRIATQLINAGLCHAGVAA